jgi:hypothetical protein
MSSEADTPVESLEIWLSNKPFWEQYVWKVNFEKDALTDEDLNVCYQFLLEHLGLVETPKRKPEPIDFRSGIRFLPEVTIANAKITVLEVRDFANVNALSEHCSIKFGSQLTLVYGSNASGKSGIGRLLCNACFSRGEREILPDVKSAAESPSKPRATFVIKDGWGNSNEINYSLGDNNDELKRFSVFDSESVLIHLDQSNQVSFTPAQIKIFDKVADAISKMEERLTNERNARKKDNPFQAMFINDDTSAIAGFCKGIDETTKDIDFLQYANFQLQIDGVKMANLEKSIEEKKKLDIPKKKVQLAADRQNLAALKTSLNAVVHRLATASAHEVNRIVSEILEKKRIAESISVKSFDDGIFKTIGSAEWKSLITAAKLLVEAERKANDGREPTHCMLCHQELIADAGILLEKYWQFLDSKAEAELDQLVREQSAVLREFQSTKALYPRFLPTDAGVRILNDEDPVYLADLRTKFHALEEILNDWLTGIDTSAEVSGDHVPTVDLARIDEIIARKELEETELIDPTGQIATLTTELNSLKHKQKVSGVKDAGLEYIAYLNWSSKAAGVNFGGIKMATTKKRTESFLVGVLHNYEGVFNQELAKLGCDFDLFMITSGDQGNTKKEYRLNFAEDYSPSQILSEGEQNVCSIADFLTEVQLDKNNCGIIFDDPVTSLDHERKDKIALRLVVEAAQRQVVVFTHDIVFMSQMVKHAGKNAIDVVAHWMRKVNGVPGCVEENTSPRLSSLSSLKTDSAGAVKEFGLLGAKEQERALGVALDYLRSACEALIEEVLFAGTIERYNDHIKVQNLEEVVFDQASALKIVDLHGRISEVILAHNRSDQQRENPPTLADLNYLRQDFDLLEKELKQALKASRKERQERKDSSLTEKVGW